MENILIDKDAVKHLTKLIKCCDIKRVNNHRGFDFGYINFFAKGTHYDAIATNGYLITRLKLSVIGEAVKDFSIHCNELKMLKIANDPVVIRFTETEALFLVNEYPLARGELITHLPEGFERTENAFNPDTKTFSFNIAALELALEALKVAKCSQVTFFTSETGGSIGIKSNDNRVSLVECRI